MPKPQPHSLYLERLLSETFPAVAELLGAEVGVFRGENSAHLLFALPNLYLYLVDAWRPDPYLLQRNRFHALAKGPANRFSIWESQARRAVAFAGRRAAIRKQDFRSTAGTPPELDFVFLDAAHSFADTADQISVWSRRVRSGGIVSGHDYDYPAPGFEGVRKAVDEAAARLNVELTVDSTSYVWHWTQP